MPLTQSQTISDALALHKGGHSEAALSIYLELLKKSPDDAKLLNLAGIAKAECGDLHGALELQMASVKREPRAPQAHFNLGSTYETFGDYPHAEASYRRALMLRPNHPQTLNNLGHAIMAQRRFKDAESIFKQCLELDSNYLPALGNLADLYERSNKLDKARDICERGLEISPRDALLNRVAASCERRDGRPETAIARLEGLSAGQMTDAQAVEVKFELGQLYDKLGDAAKAYGHFKVGNELLAALPRPPEIDKVAFLNSVQDVKDCVAPAWLERWSAPIEPEAGRAPAFLIGFPRSGTTLLNQILDCHPAIQVLEERATLVSSAAAVSRLPGGYPAALADLTRDQIQDLRRRYNEAVESLIVRRPTDQIVDKLPLNITDVPLIMRLFPTTKIILAIRHPCDACLSCFMQRFRVNPAMANFFTLDDATHLYAEVMGLWRTCAEVFPIDYHIVRYEDVVAEFEGEIGRLLHFLGLGWDDAVLEFSKRAMARGVIGTPSYHQVSQPIYRSATGRWLRYEKYLRPFKGRLEPFIAHFGYSWD